MRVPTNALFRSCILIGSLQAIVLPNMAWAEPMVFVKPSSIGGILVSAGNLNGITGGEIRLDYQTDAAAVQPSVAVLGESVQASLLSTSQKTGKIIITITDRKPNGGYLYLARINLVDQNGNPGRVVPPYFSEFTKDTGEKAEARVESGNGDATDKAHGSSDVISDAQESSQDDSLTPVAADMNQDSSGSLSQKRAAIVAAAKKRQQEFAALPAVIPVGDMPASGATTAGSLPSGNGERVAETVVLVASPSQNATTTPEYSATPNFKRLEGVLDRFRSYSGEWSPEVATRLFAAVNNHELRQEPAIAIADGNAEVLVLLKLANSDESIKCFVISGGHVTAIQPGQGGEWRLQIIPVLGTVATSVTVYTEKSIIEYPLTVAPKLSSFTARSESGKLPYLHEFVIKANELAANSSETVIPSIGEAGTN